ncbi:unnamed protein product, partial [Brugia timori]|uniref:Secreted protein n=1 Tax=Brugia timori TaxID=42155 RepID=A0A0R3Q4F4_9BILA
MFHFIKCAILSSAFRLLSISVQGNVHNGCPCCCHQLNNSFTVLYDPNSANSR